MENNNNILYFYDQCLLNDLINNNLRDTFGIPILFTIFNNYFSQIQLLLTNINLSHNSDTTINTIINSSTLKIDEIDDFIINIINDSNNNIMLNTQTIGNIEMDDINNINFDILFDDIPDIETSNTIPIENFIYNEIKNLTNKLYNDIFLLYVNKYNFNLYSNNITILMYFIKNIFSLIKIINNNYFLKIFFKAVLFIFDNLINKFSLNLNINLLSYSSDNVFKINILSYILLRLNMYVSIYRKKSMCNTDSEQITIKYLLSFIKIIMSYKNIIFSEIIDLRNDNKYSILDILNNLDVRIKELFYRKYNDSILEYIKYKMYTETNILI
jgi:hypothetical protein